MGTKFQKLCCSSVTCCLALVLLEVEYLACANKGEAKAKKSAADNKHQEN